MAAAQTKECDDCAGNGGKVLKVGAGGKAGGRSTAAVTGVLHDVQNWASS